ncbi:MAG: ABC transporter permease [Anaerolineaceae bacterium]|nr:ABC transporter permease [Anaerolineaceae bacterium]
MTQYVIRRLLATIPVLLIVTFIVFTLMFLAPGDPIYLLVDVEQTQGLTEEQLDILRHELGLDRPLIVQYGDWLINALQGDLGTSIRGSRQVSDMLKSAFSVSIELTLLAMAFALIIAIPVGIYSALKPNSLGDLLGTSLAIGGISAPNFWVALLLIYFFSVKLGWLPSNGFTRISEDLQDNLTKMVLPVITLGIALMASVMRMTRSGMLEVMHQDYIRTARAKGALERRVIFNHAFRNAMLPVLTIIGLQFGALLGGAVVIEQIFSLPGMGRLGLDAIFIRDFPVVQGVVLVITLSYLLVNLFVDLLYGVLDPRIRIS